MSAPFGPGGTNPIFAVSAAAIPTLPTLTLSEDETRLASWLATRLFEQRQPLILRGLYYDGLQKMQDLGISIPPSLAGLRTMIGWPQVGIDAIDERCTVEGFRFPGATDVDDDLMGIWQANNLDGEATLAQLDALIYGRSYIVVGPGDDSTGGVPLITAESPVNMTAIWDARLRKCTAALQIYLDADYTSDMYGQEVAALYLPDRTIIMGRPSTAGSAVSLNKWDIVTRDTHGLGEVPVIRMANRQRIGNREGTSEITPAWMNITDSACRTLLGMEVGREFHAAPRRYVLGASEDAFIKSDGSTASAWDAYMGKFMALERDEDGAIPTVGEFGTGDPKSYTTLIDTYTRIMSSLTGLPPEFLGVTTNGNPTSADAIRMAEARLVKRVVRKHVAFGEAWEQAMRLALLIRDGSLPDGAHRMETDWSDPNTPTLAATSDAITKQITVGAIPPHSDVTLRRLGYSAVERQQLEQDRLADDGEQFLNQLAHSIEAKDARVDNSLARDIGGPNAVAPAPAPNVQPPAQP